MHNTTKEKLIMKLRGILGLQLHNVLYAWNQYFKAASEVHKILKLCKN